MKSKSFFFVSFFLLFVPFVVVSSVSSNGAYSRPTVGLYEDSPVVAIINPSKGAFNEEEDDDGLMEPFPDLGYMARKRAIARIENWIDGCSESNVNMLKRKNDYFGRSVEVEPGLARCIPAKEYENRVTDLALLKEYGLVGDPEEVDAANNLLVQVTKESSGCSCCCCIS